jgi:hypothetical protein
MVETRFHTCSAVYKQKIMIVIYWCFMLGEVILKPSPFFCIPPYTFLLYLEPLFPYAVLYASITWSCVYLSPLIWLATFIFPCPKPYICCICPDVVHIFLQICLKILMYTFNLLSILLEVITKKSWFIEISLFSKLQQ